MNNLLQIKHLFFTTVFTITWHWNVPLHVTGIYYMLKICYSVCLFVFCLFVCSIIYPSVLHVWGPCMGPMYGAHVWGPCIRPMDSSYITKIGGDFTKKVMWTFEVDYATRNKSTLQLRTIVCNALHVFYDCSELRNQCQTST